MNYYREAEGLPISLISERAQFNPPRGAISATNANSHQDDRKSGTTTLGLAGKDFVVLAADQRGVMGNIATEANVPKIYPITKYVAVTVAGAVGDALAVIRFLKAQANLYEIERGTKMTPKALTTLLSNVLNNNRYYPFIFQPIIAGFVKVPDIYEATPYGCVVQKDDYAITGSGTTFAMTTLDSEYKKGMTKEEAIALAVKAVSAAKHRDIYSGGESVTVAVIDANGYREIDRKEIDKIIQKLKFN
ncbi:MAG: proteasome subunit beta [Candidatus Diapherotrites archaeon]|nr:proteasome subunit beta [Candidatus Diapherotrites archaeon]